MKAPVCCLQVLAPIAHFPVTISSNSSRLCYDSSVGPTMPARSWSKGTPPSTEGLLPAASPSLPNFLPTTVTVEERQVKKLFQAEMEEHRRLGLCYSCNEKYGHGNNNLSQHLFLLNLGDDDNNGKPDEGIGGTGEPRISLHAIASVRMSATMQVVLKKGGTAFHALLDTGSTHNCRK